MKECSLALHNAMCCVSSMQAFDLRAPADVTNLYLQIIASYFRMVEISYTSYCRASRKLLYRNTFNVTILSCRNSNFRRAKYLWFSCGWLDHFTHEWSDLAYLYLHACSASSNYENKIHKLTKYCSTLNHEYFAPPPPLPKNDPVFKYNWASSYENYPLYVTPLVCIYHSNWVI